MPIMKKPNKKNYSKEELIQKLQDWVKIHGKSPKQREIEEDPSMPSFMTYISHFGSFNAAKKAAGLKVYKQGNQQYEREYLLEKLRERAKELGRPVRAKDIDNDKSIPSMSTYRKVFGSLEEAQREAGVEVYKYKSRFDNAGKIIKEFRKTREKEGLSKSTIKTHLITLKDLEDFLVQRGKKLRGLSLEDLQDFIFTMTNQYSRKTLKVKLAAIRNLFKFILRKARLEKTEPVIDEVIMIEADSLIKRILRLKEDDNEEKEALTEEEVSEIKEKLKTHIFFLTLFEIGLNLGLRASEYKYIKAKEGRIESKKQARKEDVWIDLEEGLIRVYRQKSNKTFLLELTEEMKFLVKRQLNLRNIYGVKHEYLFFSKTRKYRLLSDTVHDHYQKISEITGIKLTAHKVRRTMATLLEDRIPHSIIRIRMGHAPKDTTGQYQRHAMKKRQKILQKIGKL